MLAKFPQLRVIARTSSFPFKGKDRRRGDDRAGSCGVAHRARRQRAQVRHPRCASPRSSIARHRQLPPLVRDLRSRSSTDIFKVQDEIAAAVVAQLKVRMLGTSLPVTLRQRSARPSLSICGRCNCTGRALTRAWRRQTAVLERLLAVNDRFGPAWQLLLGRAYAERAWVGFVPLHEGYAKARAALQRAIDVDPADAAAISALGSLAQDYDINLPEAARRLKQALLFEPNNQFALRAAGNLAIRAGR